MATRGGYKFLVGSKSTHAINFLSQRSSDANKRQSINILYNTAAAQSTKHMLLICLLLFLMSQSCVLQKRFFSSSR
jgi:hypothetical protein